MNKIEITSLINNDDILKKILNIYKKNNKTTGERIDNINNTSKNGLADSIYVIKTKDIITNIIVPIFSTSKTITWDFYYLNIIKESIPELNKLQDHEIVSKISCVLYFFDTHDNEPLFLCYNSLNDWLSHGKVGKNGASVYWWNDKLPNEYSKNNKQIVNDLFVQTLPHLTNKEIKNICAEYATGYYEKFTTEGDTRTKKQKIKNITNGLYAEILIYVQLLECGYKVNFNWTTEDDLGIDITIKQGNDYINIDVKSTSDEYLRVSRNRKETDFYAIVTWDKTNPVLIGFLNKYYFWKSKVYQTDKPIREDNMYKKKINDFVDNIITIDDLHGQYLQYKKMKMKQNANLFEVQ